MTLQAWTFPNRSYVRELLYKLQIEIIIIQQQVLTCNEEKMTLADFSLGSRKRTQWWIPWKVTTREQSDQLNVSMIHGSWRASSRACSPRTFVSPAFNNLRNDGQTFFFSPSFFFRFNEFRKNPISRLIYCFLSSGCLPRLQMWLFIEQRMSYWRTIGKIFYIDIKKNFNIYISSNKKVDCWKI